MRGRALLSRPLSLSASFGNAAITENVKNANEKAVAAAAAAEKQEKRDRWKRA